MPKNKVLDFLIVHQEFDYSLKDIARFSKVSYPCIKQLKKELIKGKWILLTRKVGKAQMYKLNIKNPVVEKFIDYFWAVVDSAVKRENNIEEEETVYHSSSIEAVPVSAKGI